MSTKLFFSTFILIFLAELGDKTQLAAMARAATEVGGKWTVFLAASSALVLSTLVAVTLGTALTRVVPESAIKVTAGILFVLFGLFILSEVVFGARLPRLAGKPGIMSHVALRMAAQFEQAAADDYRTLAEQITDERMKALMLALADEEASHARRVRSADLAFEKTPIKQVSREALPQSEALNHDVSSQDESIIEHAIEHETATADFYSVLGRGSTLPELRQTFEALAVDERQHAARLREFLDERDGDAPSLRA